jgi:hypothetical protein
MLVQCPNTLCLNRIHCNHSTEHIEKYINCTKIPCDHTDLNKQQGRYCIESTIQVLV